MDSSNRLNIREPVPDRRLVAIDATSVMIAERMERIA
jgi:hypothetical protein